MRQSCLVLIRAYITTGMVRKILHHDWIPRRQSRFVYPLSSRMSNAGIVVLVLVRVLYICTVRKIHHDWNGEKDPAS